MYSTLIALVAALSAGGQTGEAQEKAVMATVNQFVNGFNKGDVKTAVAACADQTSIIDEFAPYAWNGAGACAKWAAEFDVYAKAQGMTDALVTLNKPRHVITGDRAYVVIPADMTYKQKGKAMKQSGATLALVLQRGSAGWRITAWSWASGT